MVSLLSVLHLPSLLKTLSFCRLSWLIYIAVFSLFSYEGFCLRDVQLLIVPPAVQRGGSVVLLCQYDLEGAPLYQVSWYRGIHEFYRYSPSEEPNIKFFKFNGIYVDVTLSNSTQVILRDVSFSLSGNFSCEVTTDAPNFSTIAVSARMTVIELPKSAPIFFVEQDRYTLGDTLRANCSSPPSRPPAEITFQVNGLTVQPNAIERHSAENLLVGGNGQHRWSSPPVSSSSSTYSTYSVSNSQSEYHHSSNIGGARSVLSNTKLSSISNGVSSNDDGISTFHNSALATFTSSNNNNNNNNNGGLQWSIATLNLQLLPMHFGVLFSSTGSSVSAHRNTFQVTCTAHIVPGDYHRSTTLNLIARFGEPVHQRVMSPSSGATINQLANVHQALCAIVIIALIYQRCRVLLVNF